LELHKKALNDPVNHDEQFKRYRYLYNKVLKASKKLTLESKFKKYKNNQKKTWDLLKETVLGQKTVNSGEISEIKVGDNLIKDPKAIANELNVFFSSIGQKISDSIISDTDPTENLPDFDANKRQLEFENVGPVWITDVIKSMHSKVSLDLDGISLHFIKQIIYSIADPLSYIFTLSLKKGVFPEKFKECRIVPIFKSGDPLSCDNYRPISLVNSISKILEKIVSIKLTNHLQLNNLLYIHQYGFQRGLSTEHNLIQVINFIANSMNKGNFCIGVFLDLKKAFDVCAHDVLLKKLVKLGVMGRENDWFRSYLHNRRQKVDIKGTLSDEQYLNISVL
jgi:hypothetical protein